MTKEPYEEGLDIFRDSEADEDFRTDTETSSADYTVGQTGSDLTGDQVYGTTGTGVGGADDLTGDTYGSTNDLSSDYGTGGVIGGAGVYSSSTGDYSSSTGDANSDGGVAGKAADVAGSAKEKAGDLAATAADKAAEVKDVALERGGDVAGVAKDEIARLAHDARSEVQNLWSSASEQLRGQAATAQQQLSELLHSLSGELGEMASKSDNTGPLTALAKQAAARGGEWSHWLENSEPTDLLTELRRFARRRPFAFLASAALAGVVVGRLGRGLMAANETENTATRAVGASSTPAPVTAGVSTTPAVTYDELPSFGTEATPQVGGYSSQATSTDPYGLDDGSAR
jgi:hypothetical protein